MTMVFKWNDSIKIQGRFSSLKPFLMVDHMTLHPHHPNQTYMFVKPSMITCHAYTNKLHTNLVLTQMHSLLK